MAGRGFSFKFPKKESEKKESEPPSNQSEAQSEVGFHASSSFLTTIGRGRGMSGISSIVGSSASSFVDTIGRGRGISRRPDADDTPSQASSSHSSPAPSTVASIITGRGRGMFALTKGPRSEKTISLPVLMKVPSQPSSSEKTSSGVLSKEKTELPSATSTGSYEAGSSGGQSKEKSQDASSGIIAGRGILGNVSSDGPPRSAAGAIPKAYSCQPSAKVEPKDAVVFKKGSDGVPFTAVTNSMMLYTQQEWGIFEYEVRFKPQVDSIPFRYRYLKQLENVIGPTRNFDGVMLFLPKRLENDYLERDVEKEDGTKIRVEISFKEEKSKIDCVQFYNILFNKVYRKLKMLRVGRKVFDPTAPSLIPRHKLEVWPGYVSSVDELEGGLMLTLDVSFRVLATRTVLEHMEEALHSDRNYFKDNIKKSLIGKMVLTRYNNKSYRVDDIAFDKSPKNTFEYGDGEISYADYYKQHYNLDVADLKQPLLISRNEVRISGEREKREFIMCLIPELCYLTGLTDDMKSTNQVLRDVSTYTKISPLQRVYAYKKFLENVEGNPEAKKVLSEWGLALDNQPLKVKARVIDETKIIFGRGREFSAGDKADFTRHATSNQVLEPIDLTDWLLVYVKRDQKTADTFAETMAQVSGPTGIRVAVPKRLELQNDRNETYVNEIRKAVANNPKIQIVTIIFPSLKDDRYAAVKTLLCAEIPVPSQCLNSNTLRNPAKSRAIIQKILLQMNCKVGGALWGIKIPLKKMMICGIDTYHEGGMKGKTVGAFVASTDSSFTAWWSKSTIQQTREELVNGLTASMESALTAYLKRNNFLPESILLYRDGVGDGQLKFVETYEIPQFKEAFKRVSPDYNPILTFIVVQKRISTKFFKIIDDRTGETIFNPKPGSILDHTVTRQFLYNFYLQPQAVREGAATPSHYIVLKDEKNFEPDILHKLTFRLCHMYYNWPGTVRVPAPCQYAHKLADLVGTSIKRQVDEKLADKLYFL